MIRVLLVEDHAIVRRGVRLLIDDQADLEVVGEVSDGAEVMDAVRSTPCDVIVLDWTLPNSSGIELLRELHAAVPRTAIIVLTMHPEDVFALHLLREGASAYLNKQRDPGELLDAIRRVAGGGRYLTSTLSDLALQSPGESQELPHRRLTAREYQVFLLLIQGKTVSDVANELELSPSTVSNHVAAVRNKLGVASLGEIVRYAFRVGLV